MEKVIEMTKKEKQREANRKWREKNREKVNEYQRRYNAKKYAKNPNHWKEREARQEKLHPGRRAEYTLLWMAQNDWDVWPRTMQKYGLTHEDVVKHLDKVSRMADRPSGYIKYHKGK